MSKYSTVFKLFFTDFMEFASQLLKQYEKSTAWPLWKCTNGSLCDAQFVYQLFRDLMINVQYNLHNTVPVASPMSIDVIVWKTFIADMLHPMCNQHEVFNVMEFIFVKEVFDVEHLIFVRHMYVKFKV